MICSFVQTVSRVNRFRVCVFGDLCCGCWQTLGKAIVVIRCEITNLKSPETIVCVYFGILLGLLPGAFFWSFWAFFGVTFGTLLVPKGVLGVILEASTK